MDFFSHKTSKSVVKAHISRQPKKGRGEITRIAEFLNVSSTLISQVVAGEKIFTPEQAQAMGTYLGLLPLEADYLAYLVQFERAGTQELRKFWEDKLQQCRESALRLANLVVSDRTLSDRERSVFYSSPVYSAVRLYTSVGEKGKNLDEICDRFELPKARVVSIVNFLIETGLVIEKEGRYFLGAQKTHLEQESPHLLRHYSNWRIRAIQQSEQLTAKELMYTATVSLSRDDFLHLRAEMMQFIKSFLERVHASPAEDIACFNLDFFWIKN
jgi:hypothetical protein